MGLLFPASQSVPWLVNAVRDRPMLLGPPAIWVTEWVNIPAPAISAEDVAQWPYTAGLLVKWAAFLGSLHGPAWGWWYLVS